VAQLSGIIHSVIGQNNKHTSNRNNDWRKGSVMAQSIPLADEHCTNSFYRLDAQTTVSQHERQMGIFVTRQRRLWGQHFEGL